MTAQGHRHIPVLSCNSSSSFSLNYFFPFLKFFVLFQNKLIINIFFFLVSSQEVSESEVLVLLTLKR